MGLSLASFPRIPFSSGLDVNKPVSALAGDLYYATDTAINYQYSGSSWVNTQVNQSPIGSVIALLKSLTGTPAIPPNWVQCDGQTISDAASVYNGVAIPNLNSSPQKFLRGSSTSGNTGGNDAINLQHHHSFQASPNQGWNGSNAGMTESLSASTNILPSYYEVVWIMRIK